MTPSPDSTSSNGCLAEEDEALHAKHGGSEHQEHRVLCQGVFFALCFLFSQNIDGALSLGLGWASLFFWFGGLCLLIMFFARMILVEIFFVGVFVCLDHLPFSLREEGEQIFGGLVLSLYLRFSCFS